jgi:hypothetical protein
LLAHAPAQSQREGRTAARGLHSSQWTPQHSPLLVNRPSTNRILANGLCRAGRGKARLSMRPYEEVR